MVPFGVEFIKILSKSFAGTNSVPQLEGDDDPSPSVSFRLTLPPPAIMPTFGPMNLVADLIAVEERIEQTQDRIFRQEAMIRRLRQIHARPCVIDTAEHLRDALKGDMQAMLAHRDGIAAALERCSRASVLGAMQMGLSEPHCEIDNLPDLLTGTSVLVAEIK